MFRKLIILQKKFNAKSEKIKYQQQQQQRKNYVLLNATAKIKLLEMLTIFKTQNEDFLKCVAMEINIPFEKLMFWSVNENLKLQQLLKKSLQQQHLQQRGLNKKKKSTEIKIDKFIISKIIQNDAIQLLKDNINSNFVNDNTNDFDKDHGNEVADDNVESVKSIKITLKNNDNTINALNSNGTISPSIFDDYDDEIIQSYCLSQQMSSCDGNNDIDVSSMTNITNSPSIFGENSIQSYFSQQQIPCSSSTITKLNNINRNIESTLSEL